MTVRILRSGNLRQRHLNDVIGGGPAPRFTDLKIEPGHESRNVKAGKCKEMDSSLMPPERKAGLPTP